MIFGRRSKAVLSPGSGTTTCTASPSWLGTGGDAGPATPSTPVSRVAASCTSCRSRGVNPPARSQTTSAGMSWTPAKRCSSSSDLVDSAESGRNAAWSFSVTPVSLLDRFAAKGKTTNRPSSTTTAGSTALRLIRRGRGISRSSTVAP
jgi:hypothetical protein